MKKVTLDATNSADVAYAVNGIATGRPVYRHFGRLQVRQAFFYVPTSNPTRNFYLPTPSVSSLLIQMGLGVCQMLVKFLPPMELQPQFL